MRAASAASAVFEASAERRRVALERQPAAHDLRALRRVLRGAHLDAEPEAIEQLRAQLALLGVHRADEQEARRVHGRHRLALDAREPGRGGVEQRVDEVVGQEVDLVDVEDPAVRAGEQPGFEGLLAGERAAEVERADEPVERRAERQLDERRRARGGRRVVRDLAAGRALARRERERLRHGRLDRRQQRRERADGGRLRGPALAAHEHAADLRRDRVDEQRLDERLLADDRAERG